MIGLIIQHLYENGFFVRYQFSDEGIKGHVFHFWKRYGDKACGASHIISNLDVKNSVASDRFLQEIERYMKKVNDEIAQGKLLVEVNSIVEAEW